MDDENEIVNEILKSFFQVAMSNKDEIDENLISFINETNSSPARYLLTQSIIQLNPELVDLKLISDQLEASAYTDHTKHSMLFHIQNAIKDVDPEFIIRLHQALCKPITSDIVIHKLSDTCLNHAAPAVILAARTPKLMERLIDYVYISSPPSKTNMNFTRRRALNLMSCLFSTTAEGVAEDVETYSECYESLFLLYYWMTLPFKELLEKIEPDSICILKAHIFIKFVHHRVNSSDYYESYVDFNSTGSLHTILKRVNDINLHSLFSWPTALFFSVPTSYAAYSGALRRLHLQSVARQLDKPLSMASSITLLISYALAKRSSLFNFSRKTSPTLTTTT
ncbi:hypothetical protein DSO57_1013276 [Entomophthora muscae]|uniref:Uncharacterized protein n=1 Tax=Entomophthora muscae TaxID=34485 RepID=A0ACC2U485_9FUNG|nr:hypothetical protein DSO57_1013276 [Entomophthora muscae]